MFIASTSVQLYFHSRSRLLGHSIIERDCGINADFATRYLGYLDILAVQRPHRLYSAIPAQRCNRGCDASPFDTRPLRG